MTANAPIFRRRRTAFWVKVRIDHEPSSVPKMPCSRSRGRRGWPRSAQGHQSHRTRLTAPFRSSALECITRLFRVSERPARRHRKEAVDDAVGGPGTPLGGRRGQHRVGSVVSIMLTTLRARRWMAVSSRRRSRITARSVASLLPAMLGTWWTPSWRSARRSEPLTISSVLIVAPTRGQLQGARRRRRAASA